MLQRRVVQLGRIYDLDTGAAGVIRGLKYALERLGICDGYVALPYRRHDKAAVEQLDRLLGGLDWLK
jgi:dihydrodipicolinate synthase/N-acetylneuraminate lyase